MAVANAADQTRTVADPNAEYESVKPLWDKCRAICSGERFTKDYDGYLDTTNFRNLLIPFSPSMTQQQYDFYKAEAELPGIVSQFAKMLVGGLLRKDPELTLPEEVPEEAASWILNDFAQDDSPLIAFMDKALWEEIQTSRAWVYVDYPTIDNPDELTKQEQQSIMPYPVLWKAESVINWRVSTNAKGKKQLVRVITRGFEESEHSDNEFHVELIDTIRVHEIVDGKYQIRIFQKQDIEKNVPVISGQTFHNPSATSKVKFVLANTVTNILVNGERLDFIPAWPLNGSISINEPTIIPLVDKEVSLYNKLSRRNHLLYGASTYTPVISADMTDDQFEDIVSAGLGSWIKLPENSTISALETPTAALADMEKAIASSIEEMAKLGIRMLSPETAQSGVALEIRNAAQTAQLGTLNSKISAVLTQIITFMLNWRYGLDLKTTDVEFSLSADFNPIPLGADWLRLATEWYREGLIPRTVWLQILKQNDMLAADYDDKAGQKEINDDELLIPKGSNSFAGKLEEE
jgi:hypothetical protein